MRAWRWQTSRYVRTAWSDRALERRKLVANRSFMLPSLGHAVSVPVLHQPLRASSELAARNVAFVNLVSESKGGRSIVASMRRSKSEPGRGSSFQQSPSGRKLPGSPSRVSLNVPPAPRTWRHEIDPVQAEAKRQELLTKKRVCKLRRELSLSQMKINTLSVLAARKAMGEEVRTELRRLQGLEDFDLSGVPPATEEEASEVAFLMMRHLEEIEPEPSKRAWYKLFKDFDSNGDGHMSYDELIDMIRKQIKMPKKKLPEERIRAIWNMIDLDGDGWVVRAAAHDFPRSPRPWHLFVERCCDLTRCGTNASRRAGRWRVWQILPTRPIEDAGVEAAGGGRPRGARGPASEAAAAAEGADARRAHHHGIPEAQEAARERGAAAHDAPRGLALEAGEAGARDWSAHRHAGDVAAVAVST